MNGQILKTPDDRIFLIAVGTSVIVHAALISVFSQSPGTRFFKKIKSVETVYHVMKKDLPDVKKNPVIIPKKTSPDIDLLEKKDVPFIKTADALTKPAGHLKTLKRREDDIGRILSTHNKVTVSVFKPEKINNPLYLNYHDRVRAKIRDFVIENYSRTDTGEVYLTFAVSSDGTIQEIKVIENRTHATDYLIELGLKSLRRANPFPPFPKDLPYPMLTFNIAISFTEK